MIRQLSQGLLAALIAPLTQAHALTFDPAPLAASEKQAAQVLTSPAYEDSMGRHTLGYQVLIHSGERRDNQIFGQLYDRQGRPLHRPGGGTAVSQKNDYSSLLRVDGSLYMLTQFEEIPGALYLSEVTQDPASGRLAVKRTRPLDLTPIQGGWNFCAGSTTPWQSHLGTEEYEPDAAARDPRSGAIDKYFQSMAAYTDGNPASLDPYDYGWSLEITVHDYAEASIVRRYAMGRFSHEVALVMPDRRTVYQTDDAYNTALYRFVADRPGKLASGTLYAARWHQTDAARGGSAGLEWISLGHADDATIAAALQRKTRFEDLFERESPLQDGTCPAGFGSVNTRFGHECLRLKPGMEILASRLESRRFAALRGATTEFRKMEGLTFDPTSRQLFVAVTAIERGMEDRRDRGAADDRFDAGGQNHIRLPYNSCGAVYALPLDETFTATAMHALVIGRAVDDDPENGCDTTGIANPDNLTFLAGQRTLVIAEDSAHGHLHNMLWAYDLDSSGLTRLLSAPLGAEVTGSYYYPDINGWGYLMCTIQHPAEGSAQTGYLGPFRSNRTRPNP
jgi:uncharacterized protein